MDMSSVVLELQDAHQYLAVVVYGGTQEYNGVDFTPKFPATQLGDVCGK
jgi:hypothetical protein